MYTIPAYGRVCTYNRKIKWLRIGVLVKKKTVLLFSCLNPAAHYCNVCIIRFIGSSQYCTLVIDTRFVLRSMQYVYNTDRRRLVQPNGYPYTIILLYACARRTGRDTEEPIWSPVTGPRRRWRWRWADLRSINHNIMYLLRGEYKINTLVSFRCFV